MKSIRQAKNIKGKRVIVRAGLNVPTKNGYILNDFRIRKALLTIKALQKKGARVIVVAHIGRNKSDSLRPVAEYINKKFFPVTFVSGTIGGKTKKVVSEMKDGSVIMLENLRCNPGETKNSKEFAKKLSELGDIYVNDAFSVSHRRHASIVGLPQFLPSYGGLWLGEEIKNLSEVFKPEHPFLFIVGGAKFETKIPLIKKYISKADHIFVGGALAHNFFQVLGFETGVSRIEKVQTPLRPLLKQDSLLLPVDVIVEKKNKRATTRPSGEVQKSEKIVDAGPQTVTELAEYIQKARFIVFNGPLGFYEAGYEKATREILRAMSKSRAHTIVGGGDTAHLVTKMKIENNVSFLSTGGGSLLQFLADGTLPGIEALK